MKRSHRTPAMLDAVQQLFRVWWIPVMSLCLLVGAACVWTRAPRASSTAVATVEDVSPQAWEADATTRIRQLMLDRAITGDRPSPKFLALTPGIDERAAVAGLRERLTVSETDSARVVDVSYQDADPRRAIDVVNAVVALAVLSTPRETSESGADLSPEAPAPKTDLHRGLTALQNKVERLTANYLQRVGAFEADKRSLEAARHELSALESALASARLQTGAAGTLAPSGPSAGPASDDALLARLDSALDQLLAAPAKDADATETVRRQIEALLVEHVPGRPVLPGTTPFAAPPLPANGTTERNIATLESECATQRATMAVLAARIDATRRAQRELAAVVAKRNRAWLAYDDAVAGAPPFETVPRLVAVRRATEAQAQVVPPAQGQRRLASAAFVVLALSVLVVAGRRMNAFVLSGAGLRAIAPVPVLVAIPDLRRLTRQDGSRRRLYGNFLYSALSAALVTASVVLVNLWTGY